MKNLFTIIDNNTSYTLGKYHNNQIIYDFNNTLEYLEIKGKQRYGEHFRIYKEDHNLIYKLMIYTIKDKNSCRDNGIDLNKGILLTGPVGCGKTTLMQLLPYIHPQTRPYGLFPTRNIVIEYNTNGSDTINKYSALRTMCFDDLGAEPTGRYYGHDSNVMAEILVSRYDLSQGQSSKQNKQTHLTSNLNAHEIEDRYGERVRSRLREMVNVIAFPASTPDKRT